MKGNRTLCEGFYSAVCHSHLLGFMPYRTPRNTSMCVALPGALVSQKMRLEQETHGRDVRGDGSSAIDRTMLGRWQSSFGSC